MKGKAIVLGGFFVLLTVTWAAGFGFGGGGGGGGGFGGGGGGGIGGGGGGGGFGGHPGAGLGGGGMGGPGIGGGLTPHPGGGFTPAGPPPGVGIRPPTGGVRPGQGGWYHGRWRHYWRRGWRRGWRNGRWYRRSGYTTYMNPYVDITVKKPPKPEPGTEAGKALATKRFDEARAQFAKRGYGKALTLMNEALRMNPDDRELLEFRALCYFAQRRYPQAAADLHPVLSEGPGWDWATMLALYRNRKSYETNLRGLESYVKSNARNAASRLVLAYHYLVAERTLYAKDLLAEVIRLEPKDVVAKDLLEMIENKDEKSDEPETPTADEEEPEVVPALPEDFDATGTWRATPKEGGNIVLVFTKEKKFTWQLVRPGKTAEFAGDYMFDRSRVLLEDLDAGALIGRITPDGKDAFVFRPESEKDAPGLRFLRDTK